MTDEEYIGYELAKAAPLTRDDPVRMKLMSEHGESRWVNLPDWVQRLVTTVAALTQDEAASLVYAMGCLAEDPNYFQSPPTQAAIEKIYAGFTGTEGES